MALLEGVEPTWLLCVRAAVAFVAVGCCKAPVVPTSDSREVCVLETDQKAGLPRLYRRANADTRNLGTAPLLCDVPLASRGLGDRCEDVDDMSALLGNGKVCGPSGVSAQAVCPGYSSDRMHVEAPGVTTAVCAGGCPNTEISVHEISGTVTRVTFYDDPLCHTAADPACPGAEHRCYYRVLAVTSELR